MNLKEIWNKNKGGIIYWLFGEIKFNTRWKILMYLIQMAAIIPLFYYVVIADDFKIGKECAEFQPLIQGVKKGEFLVVDAERYRGNPLGLNASLVLANLTSRNQLPKPE